MTLGSRAARVLTTVARAARYRKYLLGSEPVKSSDDGCFSSADTDRSRMRNTPIGLTACTNAVLYISETRLTGPAGSEGGPSAHCDLVLHSGLHLWVLSLRRCVASSPDSAICSHILRCGWYDTRIKDTQFAATALLLTKTRPVASRDAGRAHG